MAAAKLFPLLVVIAACGSEPAATIRLELPIGPNDRSAIVGLELNGGAAELHALALDGAEPILWPIGQDEIADVTALFYEATLDELFLEEGPLSAIADGPAARTLPRPSAIHRASVREGSPAAFSPLVELPAALREVRIASPFACADFETLAIPLGVTSKVTFVLAYGTGTLAGIRDGGLVFVRPEGAVPLTAPPVIFFDAFVAGDGGIWLGAEHGEIWRATLEPAGCELGATPCASLAGEVRATILSREDVLSLDGPRTASPEELYALTRDGELERWDAATGGAARLYDFEDFPHTERRIGEVAWISPGEAIAVFINERAPIRYARGEALAETLPALLDDEELTSVAHLPGFGTLIGGFDGHIYRNETGVAAGWRLLSGKPGTDLVTAFVPYEHGFAWSADDGLLGQWTPEREYCPAYGPLEGAAELPSDLTAVGRDLVAAGEPDPGDSMNHVRWLIRR